MTEQQPGRDKAGELREMLIAQDARSMRGSLGRFLLGVGWCLVAVFVWATFFTLLFNALFGGSGIGWRGWFVLGVVVLIGILVWLEMRALSSDTLLARSTEDEAAAASPPATPPGAPADYAMPVRPGSPLAKLVWGPPAVLAGFRGVRGKRTRRQEAVFDRAVVILFDLAREPGRVGVQYLMHPPEDMAAFAAAIDWLEAHDWIGRSTDGASIWLSTLGQKRLVERKLMGD
jgi:hypothetical protein